MLKHIFTTMIGVTLGILLAAFIVLMYIRYEVSNMPGFMGN